MKNMKAPSQPISLENKKAQSVQKVSFQTSPVENPKLCSNPEGKISSVVSDNKIVVRSSKLEKIFSNFFAERKDLLKAMKMIANTDLTPYTKGLEALLDIQKVLKASINQ